MKSLPLLLGLAVTLGLGQISLHAQAAPSGMANGGGTDKDSGKPITTTASGLKYVDLTVGTGAAVKTGDKVTVTYVGKLTDGTVFDASTNHNPPTFDFVEGDHQVIKGWEEAVGTMKVGGERKVIIPPELGYGASGMGDVIPPNSTLIFDIKVMATAPNS